MASPNVVRILYVRGGESEAEIRRELSFRAADGGLTEHGRAQAEQVARALAALPGFDFHAEIMSSPAKRSMETASVLASHLGLTVVADERLRNIDVGELDGRSDEEAWRTYTEIVERRWAAGEWSRRFPAGENLRNLSQRLRSALLQAARPEVGSQRGDVLIVGDGVALRVALPYLIKNVEDAYPHDDMAPCAVTCFYASPRVRPSVLRMPAWNLAAPALAGLDRLDRASWEF
ncbi:MAG TPA: histidine phosphatase family protein [Actinopolymorphaceae bacterium]